jgi:tight adherence protein C
MFAGPPSEMAQRLEGYRQEMEQPLGVRRRRARQEQTKRINALMLALGERLSEGQSDKLSVRRLLLQAGFHAPNAAAVYWGIRISLTVGLTLVGLFMLPLQQGVLQSLGVTLWLAAMGWVAPVFFLRQRGRGRRREIERALPDVFDLLVTCVEAGLGLNQAMMRVAEEIDTLSPVTSEQLTLVNLEIRAGTPREDALRHLADRTGVPEVSSLVTMLIQTDRFGTSIAQALRVHADTLRTKRRQRAEEAGAKTTVKLVFPLVFFVFPAMFVVVLGPAVLLLVRSLQFF